MRVIASVLLALAVAGQVALAGSPQADSQTVRQ
jgi:hypothetical protein